MKQEKIVRVVFIAIFFMVVGGYLFFNRGGDAEPTADDEIQVYVDNLNVQVPLREDRITTLDTVLRPADRTVRYVYTIDSREFAEKGLSPLQVRSNLRPLVLANTRKDENLASFRSNGVIFEFVYHDLTGSKVMDFRFVPEEYLKEMEQN